MKYKTEPFKDRAEIYRWASEKEDIEYDGNIFKYGENGYDLRFSHDLGLYKKVIYTKKKQFWLWDICNSSGTWHRCECFQDENGMYTDGDSYRGTWSEIKKRKVEDSLLEIEE